MQSNHFITLLGTAGWRAPVTNVAVFGDSISNQNFGTGTYEGHGYLVATNALMGWPMSLVANGGVSGNTTTQMLARLGAFLDANPTVGTLFILGGTNDPGNSIVAATTISNLDAMYALCRQKRVRPIGLTILPRSDQGTGGLLTFIQTVNTAILANTRLFAVIDSFTAMADPGNSSLPYANSTLDSAPAVHPSIGGAVRIARDAAVSVLTPIMGTNSAGTSDNLDYREYASNPMVLGDNASGTNGWTLGTGTSGTGPNGWSGRRRSTGTGTASKSGSAAQMVGAFTANWDGAGYCFGGDDVLALGRYDLAWAATTAYAIGVRRRPTTPNGYHYRVITGGTSAGSEPTWPTTEGTTFTDGTVTWLCQRMPQTGDTFIATVDLAFSGVTSGKWIAPVLRVDVLDTTSTGVANVISNNVDLASSADFGLDYAPPSMRLVTPVLTMPSTTLRYLRATILTYGQASGGITMQVLRGSIRRLSP